MDDYKIIVEQDNSTVVGRYETPKRTQKEPSLLCLIRFLMRKPLVIRKLFVPLHP